MIILSLEAIITTSLLDSECFNLKLEVDLDLTRANVPIDTSAYFPTAVRYIRDSLLE